MISGMRLIQGPLLSLAMLGAAAPAHSWADEPAVPAEIPGANVPLVSLPPNDPAHRLARAAAVKALYPRLPPITAAVAPSTDPAEPALTLAELEEQALAASPTVRQAAADVDGARGAAQQAGAYPNPTFGYQSDTVGTGSTAGYQGAFVEQAIKTGGKLRLARAAAEVDVCNAQLALQRAQSDVRTQVRAGYYAVLVARENVRLTAALVRFMDNAYQQRVELVEQGATVDFEPAQARAMALQLRTTLTQARHRADSAWKQLAVLLGTPAMPPPPLVGSANAPVPTVTADALLAQVLARHTDVLTAQNSEQRARLLWRLAQATPIPDVNIKAVVQKDFTTPPFNITHNWEIGVPIALWDRNRGGIQQAHAALVRAAQDAERIRQNLSTRAADAMERYETNHTLVHDYRTAILPDLTQVYHATVARAQKEPDKVNFNDIAGAQQNLVGAVAVYIVALGAEWTAVVDLADLLQCNDLAELDQTGSLAPVIRKSSASPIIEGQARRPHPAHEGVNGRGNIHEHGARPVVPVDLDPQR